MGDHQHAKHVGPGSFDTVEEARAFIAAELGGEYLAMKMQVAARLLRRSYQVLRKMSREGKFPPARRLAATPRSPWIVTVDRLARWLTGEDLEPLPPAVPDLFAAETWADH